MSEALKPETHGLPWTAQFGDSKIARESIERGLALCGSLELDRNRWRSVAERMDAFMQHDDDCMVVNGSVGDQCTCGLSDVESAFDSLRKEAASGLE